MSTSTDIALTKNIVQMMDDQNKMVEKMGAYLTQLEESRFNRHIGEEEKEEIEGWDENDRNEYETNKKFEKLTTDTLAM